MTGRESLLTRRDICAKAPAQPEDSGGRDAMSRRRLGPSHRHCRWSERSVTRGGGSHDGGGLRLGTEYINVDRHRGCSAGAEGACAERRPARTRTRGRDPSAESDALRMLKQSLRRRAARGRVGAVPVELELAEHRTHVASRRHPRQVAPRVVTREHRAAARVVTRQRRAEGEAIGSCEWLGRLRGPPFAPRAERAPPHQIRPRKGHQLEARAAP